VFERAVLPTPDGDNQWLTLHQIELVQALAIIAPIADGAAALFYRRLFEIDPGLSQCSREIWPTSARS
jgi:hypothetical protein